MSKLVHTLRAANQRVGGEIVKATGLTPAQYLALEALLANGSCSQAIITYATGIDRSTLTPVLKRMAAKDWITVAGDPEDARAHIVSLTKVGAKVARTAVPKVEKIIASLTADVGEKLPEDLRKVAYANV